jgi:hypothetical protein
MCATSSHDALNNDWTVVAQVRMRNQQPYAIQHVSLFAIALDTTNAALSSQSPQQLSSIAPLTDATFIVSMQFNKLACAANGGSLHVGFCIEYSRAAETTTLPNGTERYRVLLAQRLLRASTMCLLLQGATVSTDNADASSSLLNELQTSNSLVHLVAHEFLVQASHTNLQLVLATLLCTLLMIEHHAPEAATTTTSFVCVCRNVWVRTTTTLQLPLIN